jgi:hypothetical protein
MGHDSEIEVLMIRSEGQLAAALRMLRTEKESTFEGRRNDQGNANDGLKLACAHAAGLTVFSDIHLIYCFEPLYLHTVRRSLLQG